MAVKKRIRKRRAKSDFPEVTGKVVQAVEVKPAEHGYDTGHSVHRQDVPGFDVDPLIRIKPDFSDWKTGDYKQLKRWPSALSS